MKERCFENTEYPKFSFGNGIIVMTRETQEKKPKTNKTKKSQRYLQMASHLEKATYKCSELTSSKRSKGHAVSPSTLPKNHRFKGRAEQ